MNPQQRPLSLIWMVGLALLAFGTVGANWLLHLRTGGTALAGGTASSQTAPPTDEPIVVCFGYVDVQHGVRSLHPTQPGRVAEILVEEGTVVKANAPLLRIEDTQSRQLVEEARADLEAAEAQFKQAKSLPDQHAARLAQQQSAIEATKKRLSAAEHVLTRKQVLFKANQNAPEEVQAATDLVSELHAALAAEREKLVELQLVKPDLQVARAKADVEAKRSRLKQAQYALDECTLKAPMEGEVLRILVGPGDLLGPAPRQPAILFCPTTPRFIRAEVSQEFAGRLQVGQKAIIQDDSRARDEWTGAVTRLSDWYTQRRSVIQEPLQVNDVRTLECIVTLDPGQRPLRIGQRMRVTINVAAK
jgi:multidrug resistance efflux pump